MSLRTRFILYWVLLHLAFAVSMGVLLREQREWLLAVELLLAVSLLVALRLLNRMMQPLRLVQQGTELIRDNFASASFQLTGHREIDSVLGTYNLMLDSLRKERLRMQEQHFLLEKIVTASPTGIITLDFNERIAMANPKANRLLQAMSAGLEGLSLSDLPAPFGQVLAGLSESAPEVVLLPSRAVIRCTRSSFYDQGFSRGFLLLEELTDEVRASEKAAFEKAIRVLSHEVNNSIGAANSLLCSLLHYKPQLHPSDQPDFEMALQVVISRTEHLNQFMRSYVDIVRLPDPVFKPVSIYNLVQKSVTLFEAEFDNRSIIVEYDWQLPTDILVNLDQGQLGQVLVNILKNALESIGTGGFIKISFRSENNSLWLEIADTGNGISEEAKSHLFSPFFSTKQNGQGVGLALVQEILHRHHFPFMLENTEGTGAVFRIVLPR